jgi:hypothetical protein
MMTAKEYRGFLEKLDMSQGRAAKMFELDPRTSRRYALDEVNIHEAVNIVLRLMLKHKYTADDIDKLREKKLL